MSARYSSPTWAVAVGARRASLGKARVMVAVALMVGLEVVPVVVSRARVGAGWLLAQMIMSAAGPCGAPCRL